LAYNALGQYTTLTRYQSTSTSNLVATSTYTYDTLNRLTALDHKQNSTDLALYDFTYDFMNRITSMTHSVDGASNYTYDKESEVTAADHPSPQSDESYSYDATGNRTDGGYTNTTNNRTTADGTYTYEYDAEGNRSKRTKNSDGSYEEYTWDHRNRLAKVTFKNSSHTVLKTVEQAYDTLNRRVRRTYDSDGPAGAAATDIFFAGYDGINPALQFSGTAASDLDHRYLFNREVLDHIFADEDLTSLSSAGNVLWPLGDHQNTARDLADLNEGSGVTSVTNHRFYDGVGNLKSESNSAVDHEFGWMNKWFDPLTAFYDFYARPYDPFLGKFPTQDPISFLGGDTNLGCIVGNNLINLTDPLGLSPPMPLPITGLDPSIVVGLTLSPGPSFGELYAESFLPWTNPHPVDAIDSGLAVGKWVGWGMALVGTGGVVLVEATGVGAAVVIGGGGTVVGGTAVGGTAVGGSATTATAATAGGTGGTVATASGVAGTAGTTPAGATVLANGTSVVGWVYNGQVVTASLPVTSHAALGTQAGVVVNGQAIAGAEAFTAIKAGGELTVIGSSNFGGILAISGAAIEAVKVIFK
jgi:RHS repeat-associated protein